jgi:hypothetical protein
VVFAPGVGNNTLRTDDAFRATCKWIQEEGGESGEVEKTFGIKHCSPLLKLPNFDMITGLPTEYMHLITLGVVKKVLCLFLCIRKDGGQPIYMQKAVASLNKSLRNVRTPSEFSRRTRDFKLAHWKAEEYRNLLLFFFPCLLPHLQSRDEKTLWLLLVYAVRAFILPDTEYQTVRHLVDVPAAVNDFYHLFHKLYKSQACSYNIHVYSHLAILRHHGPLTTTSAFRFESFLAVLKESFHVGTPNVTKQIFENLFLSMAVKGHVCHPSLKIKTKETNRTDDTLLRAYNKWYKAVGENDDGILCKTINTEAAYFELKSGISVNFGHVGVFCDLGIGGQAECAIPLKDVTGKGIRVGEYIVYCPYNVAFEC